tara:strand:+ start:662 stop:1105 length:444 start_codon:yes stop_codon:yes gene_type:complete
VPGKKDFSKFVGLASEQADRDMVYKDLQARGKDTNNRMFDKGSKIKQVNPGKIKQLKLFRLGGLASADPFGDKRRKESARTTAKLKKGAKSVKKIKTKPIKISVQSASITTPRGMSIEKNTIMPKMMSKGGVVNMTRSIQINPETGE